MNVGVNDNGVQWILDNEIYYCTYYIGEGIELTKEFKNVTIEYINTLTFEDIKE